MDDFIGYEGSWSGFVDYSKCYHKVKILTVITQSIIIIGAIVSMLPQVIKVVRRKTSHGIAHLFGFLSAMQHIFVVWNYFFLHNADFIGLLQVPFGFAWQRFLSFLNYFVIFIFYLPVFHLLVQLFDRAYRKNYSATTNRRSFIMIVSLLLIYYLSVGVISVIFFVTGFLKGYHSEAIQSIGKIIGTSAIFFSVTHYLPQFITTCRLKGEGSLSIIMLSLQAPGGLISAAVMAFGQREHWSTFLCMLVASAQQVLLLVLCIFYKCRNMKHQRHPRIDKYSETTTPFAHADTESKL